MRKPKLNGQLHDFETIGPVRVPALVEPSKPIVWEAWYYGFPRNSYSALILGDIDSGEDLLVRVSSMCIWGHLFGSRLCDCAWQWQEAQRRIAAESRGLLIFCHDDHGKGVGLRNHYLIYTQGQLQGLDLVVGAYEKLGFREDYRSYDEVARILKHLKVRGIRLLTNSPKRVIDLRAHGLEVIREPIEMAVDHLNSSELSVKRWHLGHLLKLTDSEGRSVSREAIEHRARQLVKMMKKRSPDQRN